MVTPALAELKGIANINKFFTVQNGYYYVSHVKKLIAGKITTN